MIGLTNNFIQINSPPFVFFFSVCFYLHIIFYKNFSNYIRFSVVEQVYFLTYFRFISVIFGARLQTVIVCSRWLLCYAPYAWCECQQGTWVEMGKENNITERFQSNSTMHKLQEIRLENAVTCTDKKKTGRVLSNQLCSQNIKGIVHFSFLHKWIIKTGYPRYRTTSR